MNIKKGIIPVNPFFARIKFQGLTESDRNFKGHHLFVYYRQQLKATCSVKFHTVTTCGQADVELRS